MGKFKPRANKHRIALQNEIKTTEKNIKRYTKLAKTNYYYKEQLAQARMELKRAKTKLRQFLYTAVPEEGEFIAYKKCFLDADDNVINGITGKKKHPSSNQVIVELLVPATSDRLSASANEFKARVARAKVLSITSRDGRRQFKVARSRKRWEFKYRVGLFVVPEKKFDRKYVVCTSGIHCFMVRGHACTYNNW